MQKKRLKDEKKMATAADQANPKSTAAQAKSSPIASPKAKTPAKPAAAPAGT